MTFLHTFRLVHKNIILHTLRLVHENNIFHTLMHENRTLHTLRLMHKYNIITFSEENPMLVQKSAVVFKSAANPSDKAACIVLEFKVCSNEMPLLAVSSCT